MPLDPSTFVADRALVEGLEKQSTTITCGEERILVRQEDDPAGLYILKSGPVTLTMSSASGKEYVSIEALAGSVFGLPGLTGDQPCVLTATAHAGAELSFLTRDTFTDLMRTDPKLALSVLEVLAAEVRAARSALLKRKAPAPRRRGN